MDTKFFTLSILYSALFIANINTSQATSIYRCVSTTGKVSYTGVPCAAGTTSTAINLFNINSDNTITKIQTNNIINNTALFTDQIFSTNSFWYKPIPLSVTLHPNSVNFVKEFIRQKTSYYNNVNINTYSYSSPVYIASASTPKVKVAFNNCQKKTWVDPVFMNMMSAVPIPDIAKQSNGTDGEMSIYQPSTDTLWEMWKAKKDEAGQWFACWGGKISNAAQNTGIFQKYYGTTASGLPFIGGQVTAEELQRGEIKHAIGIALVDLEKSSIFSWPANRSDGWNPNNAPNRIAEGQRFRLDPSVNVDALSMSKVGKIIAKAAQKYGFVVWDKAGSVSIRAQNAVSYTATGKPNPYTALYENKPAYTILNNFPWNKLQFLPMNYGK